MKKIILLSVAIVMIVTLSACNILTDDSGEENEEEIDNGEGIEEEPEEEEAEESEPEADEEEEESRETEEEEDEDLGNDQSEEDEDAVAVGNLTTFYGTWEMEDEEGAFDTMILEIAEAEAKVAKNQNEDFEYIRFGYKYSEFFPMEKIVEIKKLESPDAYFIVTSYVEEEAEESGSMIGEGSREDSQYTIELIDGNRLLLTYMNDEDVNEMYFTKE